MKLLEIRVVSDESLKQLRRIARTADFTVAGDPVAFGDGSKIITFQIDAKEDADDILSIDDRISLMVRGMVDLVATTLQTERVIIADMLGRNKVSLHKRSKREKIEAAMRKVWQIQKLPLGKGTYRIAVGRMMVEPYEAD